MKILSSKGNFGKLLLVLFALILLGAIVILVFKPQVKPRTVMRAGSSGDLEVRLASQLIATDAGQIALYKRKNGVLPATLNDLGAPSENNAYFTTDSWGNNFYYHANSDGTFELRSSGPDGKFNTSDDISQSF